MLLSGENVAFLDVNYSAWLNDPKSVDAEWRAVFESWERPTNGQVPFVPEFPRRSIFAGGGVPAPAAPAAEASVLQAAERQAKVAQLTNAYRVRGHQLAELDPLGLWHRPAPPELDPAFFGLSEADFDQPVHRGPLFGEPDITTPRKVLARLKANYCGRIGIEYMNMQDVEQRRWIQSRVETLADAPRIDRTRALRMLRKFSDAENFEKMLQARFPGTKRFSLEGGDAVVPLLDILLEEAAERGVKESIIGMSHRGRLNVLANILEKPMNVICLEFQDVKDQTFQGSGDVKYHLGYSSDYVTAKGANVHLSLTPNPSHLEAVDPIVEGRARAKQDRAGDAEHATVMPLLLHGDAAFAGQGLIAEVFNLSDLPGYCTGGTIHVVVNNQIGFTTSPTEGRSTPYATDIARMLAIPIFHVNGEDAEAVAAVANLAVEWRQAFKRDVVIDLYCFRRYGHNEGDEPSFTQPQMYDAIKLKPPPRVSVAKRLVAMGLVTDEEVTAIADESMKAVEDESANVTPPPPSTSALKDLWSRYVGGSTAEVDTRLPAERISELLTRANTLPDGFNAHPKILRMLAQRLEMVRGEKPLDWAIGEQAAYATLVAEGFRVRLSGQDSGRGTFTHRHAELTDVKTGAELYPLSHVADKQAPFEVLNSSLSELGVLGFEFGYSWDYPDALVLWEAQFGDFVNGAQVVIDQYIVSAETKWNRHSGLVMLLPHGFEGQGPEHSSARPERFLQLCAEDNIQVANCTTPSSFYHLLRRQMLRQVRKPLVIMTPKSLLRHPEAVSTLADLSEGAFEAVIGERELAPGDIKRVVLCSGKVYYDLLAARRKSNNSQVALVRLELLYPFPADAIRAVLSGYAPDVEIVWCQEEPRNQGSWPMFDEWFEETLGSRRVRYVGRKAAASPATGSHKKHVAEQDRLVTDALTL